jgi:hypothetical protein
VVAALDDTHRLFLFSLGVHDHDRALGVVGALLAD